MDESKKIADIIRKIADGYDPDRIVLFGSYARNEQNENSDIDILVVKNSDKSRPQRSVQLRKLLFGAKIPIDLLVYTPEEIEKEKKNKYSLISEVLNHGKVVYERQD